MELNDYFAPPKIPQPVIQVTQGETAKKPSKMDAKPKKESKAVANVVSPSMAAAIAAKLHVTTPPGTYCACCDAKTTVIVINSMLMAFSVIAAIWCGINEDFIGMVLNGCVLALCIAVFYNFYMVKSAAIYITIGTTLALIIVIKTLYESVIFYEFLRNGTGGRILSSPLEMILLTGVLVSALVQLYRFQNFTDLVTIIGKEKLVDQKLIKSQKGNVEKAAEAEP